MKHIGLLCPPTPGHLTSMCSLGKELRQRQYQVTLFCLPDVEEKIERFRLGFDGIKLQIIGANDFPKGSLDTFLAQNSNLSGIQAIRFTIRWSKKATKMMLREAPGAIHKAGVDFLLIDQLTVAGGTLADHLKLPYVTICSALPLDPEPDIPPYFTSWEYKNIWWAKQRNRLAYNLLNLCTYPVFKIVARQRQKWGLMPYRNMTDANSPLAQICQLPQMLDYPRKRPPSNLYCVNAFRDLTITSVAIEETFPFEKLNNLPIIYASLGTLQNRLFNVFHVIAEACQHLSAQLVISLGGGAEPEELPQLPGSPLVVKFAPQLELLRRTTLTITHAGQNTVLESLACGVPMVAIPITNDQPGVAARIAYAGVGEVVPVNRVSATNLKAIINKVFYDKRYKIKASQFSAAIQNSEGLKMTAEIIEKVMEINNSKISKSIYPISDYKHPLANKK